MVRARRDALQRTNASSVFAFAAPAVGDLVWCRFPDHSALRPVPPPRPAIVIALNDASSPVRVRVVCGSSQHVAQFEDSQMVIHQRNAAALASAGLSYTTWFDFRRAAWLSYTSAWFAPAPSATGPTAASPRMGQLHPSSMGDFMRAAEEAGLLRRG